MSGTAGMANGRSSTSTDLGHPPSCPIEGPGQGPCVVASQRSTLCPWNVAAGSLLDLAGILPVTSPYCRHLCTCVTKSHLDIKASSRLFPASPLTFTLFLPVGTFFRLGYPECQPQEPPFPTHFCWPGLALAMGEEAPAVHSPGSEEEEVRCDKGPSLQSLLFWGPQGSTDEPP